MTTLDTGGPPAGDLDSPDEPPARPDRVRTVVRGIGELLITAGLVVLLFVVYEVYVTDIVSAGKQREATSQLDTEWNDEAPAAPEQQRVERFDGLGEGAGFAKMHIPSFGADYSFTIIEGTTERSLEIGPGHYKGTAYPGEPGNFAVAGHRVGKGAPFNDIDLLGSCDAIVVETRFNWFVYRMLPKKDEVDGWAAGKGTDPRCQGVAPLGGPYTGLVGQQIVNPSQGTVIAPIPGQAGGAPSIGERATLMTLTTCHPRFSDRQRLIVHAVLVKQWAKDPTKPGETPPELKETS
ncbi:class E sortase [Actinokineospora terrae]|uniref:LPXTG-site transpeptidase (Sortase) family protein n=1 Tax=Actinokineospora terrae TaxID=155974 RepID=A0A1H9XS56_9PSEU|nr:class E sortase [Actinokineospora terrae]SES48971.1 LPXTG-site transpeptidase (sortase) family protein [Actinokineospora terrae]